MDELTARMRAASPPGSGEVDMADIRARNRRRRGVRVGLACAALVVLAAPVAVAIAGPGTDGVVFAPSPSEPVASIPPDVARPEAAPQPGPGTSPTEPGPPASEDDMHASSSCDRAPDPVASEGEVLVYFSCHRGTAGAFPWDVRAVTRPAGAAPLRAALTAWLEGPTDEERSQGYTGVGQALDPGDLVDVRIDDGHATVDLAADVPARVNNWGTSHLGMAIRSELNEIVFQFPTVDVVTYRLGGDPAAFCTSFELVRDCVPISEEEWRAQVDQMSASVDPRPDEARWSSDRERRAWQEMNGEGTWVVAYFLPTDHIVGAPPFSDLEPGWHPVTVDPPDQTPEELLRRSFAELGRPPPAGLANRFTGHDVELRSAVLDEQVLRLDFAPGDWTQVAAGTSGEWAMLGQIAATAAHHFPQAEQLCITVDGEETELFSHGMSSCPPFDLPG